MSTIRVTVDIEVNLPDAEAREHARWMVERHGLNVVKVAIHDARGTGKTFIPKAGKPGSVITRDGMALQVWAEGPTRDAVWAVPVDRKPEHAPIYLVQGPYAWPRNNQGRHLRRENGEWVAA